MAIAIPDLRHSDHRTKTDLGLSLRRRRKQRIHVGLSGVYVCSATDLEEGDVTRVHIPLKNGVVLEPEIVIGAVGNGWFAGLYHNLERQDREALAAYHASR